LKWLSGPPNPFFNSFLPRCLAPSIVKWRLFLECCYPAFYLVLSTIRSSAHQASKRFHSSPLSLFGSPSPFRRFFQLTEGNDSCCLERLFEVSPMFCLPQVQTQCFLFGARRAGPSTGPPFLILLVRQQVVRQPSGIFPNYCFPLFLHNLSSFCGFLFSSIITFLRRPPPPL